MKNIDIRHLGTIAYQDALSVMLDLRAKRQKNLIPDTLLFLQHQPVITSGRQDAADDLKVKSNVLKEMGVDYQLTDRGGRLTFHGPGQLVIYFILDIVARGLSVDELVCQSLSVIQDYLKKIGLEAIYDKENPGLWIGDKKIAAVGFHIQKGITTHGISFNICNDLSVYDLFIPCGIQNKDVTSIECERQQKVSIDQVEQILAQSYSDFFAD